MMGNLCKTISNNNMKNTIVTNNISHIVDVSISENKNTLVTENWMSNGYDISWKDAVKFTVPIKGGRVIKVYDGDTITIVFKLPYENSLLYRESVRLNGIDSPEIKGKNENEKISAQNSKAALSDLILNKYVTLENIDCEKYGRILADVYLKDLHVNKWMLDNNFAVPYDGKTKKTYEI